jgi:hypothetical protein
MIEVENEFEGFKREMQTTSEAKNKMPTGHLAQVYQEYQRGVNDMENDQRVCELRTKLVHKS